MKEIRVLKYIVLQIFLWFVIGQTISQNFYYKKYQIEDGLSYNSVTTILQDSLGFIWIGTEDGLNRFDGNEFVIYKNNAEDSTSIGDNYILSLFEDDEHHLWVGTQKGIFIFDREKFGFSKFDLKTEDNVLISSGVTKILETQKGYLWIATLGQGLFIYDKNNNTLVQNSIHTTFAWDLAEDQRHRIYASSAQEGLICFDQNGKFIQSYGINGSQYLKEEDIRINTIYPNHAGVWYSMGNNGLFFLNTNTNTIEQIVNAEHNMGIIRSIMTFTEKELLLGTDYGLYLYNTINKKFRRLDNVLDSRSLSDQRVQSIFLDSEGGFWIGTNLGGINYLSQQTRVFDYYHPLYNRELGLGRIINQFAEDNAGNIWIGTQSGLKKLDQNDYITSSGIPRQLDEYDIRSLLVVDNKVWIGTLGYGLITYDLKTNQLKEYTSSRTSSNSIISNNVYSIYQSSNGSIYVGTSGGVSRYNSKNDNFDKITSLSTMMDVSDILEDEDNTLWIATNNSGVYRYTPENKMIWQYTHNKEEENSIVSNSVLCLFKDENNIIWFGSNGNGLCYYDKANNSFKRHEESLEILKNKVIFSIEQDNIGRLWISTSSGLACIDISNNTAPKLYTKENGIQSNQFVLKSSLESSAGKMFFGGINGFNSFYPNELKRNDYSAPTYITDIKIHGEKNTNKLFNNFSPTSKNVELSYKNNSFTINYAVLSYEEPRKNSYSYKLEGLDDRWIHNKNSNSTSFTNIPPGKYIFRVMGANNDGINDSHGASIKITIVPPWWKSNTAYILYVILLFTLIIFGLHYWNERAQKKAKKAIATFGEEKEKELYQSKINFFINLVHEIRTPLSLINLPLDYLNGLEKIKKDTQASKYIGIIDKNVKYLLGIVNQLLDFQKIENKIPDLNFTKLQINNLIKEMYDRFFSYAELKKIDLSLSLPEENKYADIDKSIIDKIFFNLIDNAIRYAKSRVKITLQNLDDHMLISVSDDGEGISDIEKNKIFQPFYQGEEHLQGGTGIGLAFSLLLAKTHGGSLEVKNSEWGGAQFELKLPYEHQADSEISEIVGQEDEQETAKEDNTKADNQKRSTILLVEDNEELLQLTSEFLAERFNTLTAYNGQEALNILKDNDVDIVISDIMMPVMNGLELTKAIKENLEYSHVPVILLTAKVTTGSKEEGMEYGADIYIEKPFTMRQIESQIENILKLREAFRTQLSRQTTLNIPTSSISKQDQEFLIRLEEEIDNHLNESDFYIDSIAETMYMSRSSFYRKVKSITGVSPSEFLKTLRLNKAAQMLAEGSYNIGEVYVYVGFSSSSYFAKCFKEQFGILPKDFVATIRNNPSDVSEFLN